MPMLTEVQLKAIACLEAGMSQDDTAVVAGVSRRTIQRWLNIEEFDAELKRRRSRGPSARVLADEAIAEAETEASARMQSAMAAELRHYREEKLRTYQRLVNTALTALDKIDNRLRDLPDEAIAPNMIAPLANAFTSMLTKGLEEWGDLLAINDLLAEMGEDGDRHSAAADQEAASGTTGSIVP